MLPTAPSNETAITGPANRANGARPVSLVGRSYLAWSFAFFGVLAVVFALGAFERHGDDGVAMDVIGNLLMSLGLAFIAGLAFLRLLASCIRRKLLSTASAKDVRALLVRSPRQPRIDPKQRAIWSLRIGTVLFVCGVVGYAVRLAARGGSVGP